MSEGEGVSKKIPIVWWFLGGAALVTLLFYREFVFHPGRLLAGSDMLLEGYPLRRFYVDEIRAGRGIPLWTPHVYAGMPYVALLPGPIFYPSTLLYFALPLYRAIGWTFVLHTFLGGAFAYFLGRSFRLRPAAAAVCGASFMLTGYVTSHLFGGQDGRMFAMALIPLALGMLERGLRSGEARWYCGLAFVVALQVFTPHTQVMYFSSLALALYLVFHLAVRVGRPGLEGKPAAGRPYLRPLAGFALAFVGAAAVGAVQLLPTFALLPEVTRAATEQGYAFAASWALPPQELTALFLPDLVGSLPGIYWGTNPIKLHTEYLGAVPLALALLALAASFRGSLGGEERRVVWFLAGASILGILFALGGATPVHRIGYALLPLMKSFRAPAMMMGPVTVFVALLAGFGWQAVLSRREEAGPDEGGPGLASWPLLGLLSAPVLALALAAAIDPAGLQRFVAISWYEPGWPRAPGPELAASLRVGGLILLAGFAVAWGAAFAVARRRVAAWAVLAVIAFGVGDLWRVGARYLSVADAEAALADDPVLARLRSQVEPGERVWAAEGTYRPNRLMYHGLSSPVGSQKFLLRPYAELLGGIRPEEGLIQYPALIPLFHIRYLITVTPQTGLPPVLEEGGRRLYEIPSLPHALFPARVEAVESADVARTATRANADPRALAVIETVPGRRVPEAGEGSAVVARYEPDLVVLDVEAARSGLLAVSEIHHPGWRAYVDDVETPIWRTNAAFRGVEVPEGRHQVVFRYRSAAFGWGVVLSLVAALGMAAIALWSVRAARRG